jgi:hypothetical protein
MTTTEQRQNWDFCDVIFHQSNIACIVFSSQFTRPARGHTPFTQVWRQNDNKPLCEKGPADFTDEDWDYRVHR